MKNETERGGNRVEGIDAFAKGVGKIVAAEVLRQGTAAVQKIETKLGTALRKATAGLGKGRAKAATSVPSAPKAKAGAKSQLGATKPGRAVAKKAAPVKAKKAAPVKATQVKRTPEEVDLLANKLFKVIETTPGLTMEKLSAAMGEKTAVLTLPMQRLHGLNSRAAKVSDPRVWSTGSKRATRYFVVGYTEPGASVNGAAPHGAFAGEPAPAPAG